MRSVVIIAVLAGCGDHHDSPHDTGGGIDPLHYAELQANARCQYEARCGLWASEQACEMYIYTKSIPDPSLPAAIAAGKTKFDAAQAQACLDAIAATPCDQTVMAARAPVMACLAAVTGLGALGDACAQNSECASATCNIVGTSMACPTGTCAAAPARAQLDESCNNRDCVDGLACAPDTMMCVARSGVGGACLDTDECDYGLGCDFTAKMCVKLPLLGEPCANGACAETGARCLSGTCTARGTTGAPCTGLQDCQVAYGCITNVCQPSPTLGQMCTFDCSDGSWCDMTQPVGGRTCLAQAPSGAPCVSSPYSCATFYCDAMAGMCADPPVCI